MADSVVQDNNAESEATGAEARYLTQIVTDPVDGRTLAHVPYMTLYGAIAGPTLRVSAGAGAAGQSLKTFSSSGGVNINAGATVNVYTVTAGKTLFISDVLISADSATPILVQLKAGATVIMESYVSTTAPLDMTGIETQVAVGAGVALTVVFPTAAGKNGSYFIAGFEQ